MRAMAIAELAKQHSSLLSSIPLLDQFAKKCIQSSLPSGTTLIWRDVPFSNLSFFKNCRTSLSIFASVFYHVLEYFCVHSFQGMIKL